jgi:hypothetical protein
VFLADKIYFGGQKHTLPCSDEHQNPPTKVAGFEANHLAGKQAPKCRKYSRCKVKTIYNKIDVYNLCQPLPNTTTRKKWLFFCVSDEEKEKNQNREGIIKHENTYPLER